ncbi:MAG: hypothetical protein HC854_16485 [Flavobacterium sp.]|nr:hypothetical protein [Flavobacterium sp.]
MKIKILKIGFLLILIIINLGFEKINQTNNIDNWSQNDKNQYTKLTALANYIYQKENSEISKDSLFKKYIFFDNVLNDTVQERKERRILAFDTLFYYFKKKVDSIGLKNLDAKPVRFYKNHKIYEPFNEEKAKQKTVGGAKMYEKDDNVLHIIVKKILKILWEFCYLNPKLIN